MQQACKIVIEPVFEANFLDSSYGFRPKRDAKQATEKVKKEMGLNTKLPTVLVFGGSQGAMTINKAVLDIVSNGLNKNYQIIWAPGKKQYDIIQQELSRFNININNVKNTKIMPYIYNMQEMMSASELIIARSGAMTITEISIIGKPAIFIPLPSRNANRQEDNAKVLEKIDAAKIILDAELGYKKLANTIEELISNEEILKKMGNNARKIAIDNAEEKIYEEVKKLIK